MKRRLLLFVCLLQAGCAAQYACPGPESSDCRSLGDVYRSLLGVKAKGTDQRSPRIPASSAALEAPVQGSGAAPGPVPGTGAGVPLLSRPRHLRLWLNRWIDSDGDLHDESLLYLRLDQGAWRLHPPPMTGP